VPASVPKPRSPCVKDETPDRNKPTAAIGRPRIRSLTPPCGCVRFYRRRMAAPCGSQAKRVGAGHGLRRFPPPHCPGPYDYKSRSAARRAAPPAFTSLAVSEELGSALNNGEERRSRAGSAVFLLDQRGSPRFSDPRSPARRFLRAVQCASPTRLYFLGIRYARLPRYRAAPRAGFSSETRCIGIAPTGFRRFARKRIESGTVFC